MSGGYGHDFRKIANDHYRLSWTIDRKHEGSRLRFPTSFSRDTDEAGAKRFAKKWRLPWMEASTDLLQHQGGEK